MGPSEQQPCLWAALEALTTLCLGFSQDTDVDCRTIRLVFETELGPVRKQYCLLGNCGDACYFLGSGFTG